MLSSFQWFVARYLAKNFHTLAVHRHALLRDFSDGSNLNVGSFVGSSTAPQDLPIGPADNIVVYANHASWWDPLAAIFVAQRLFAGWAMYAPIDAEALRQYPMFGRMGFFGVEQHSSRGAAEFLRTAEGILKRPATSLWLTPEGRFADVRDTTAKLMPGLAHLARKLSKPQHLPLGQHGSAAELRMDGRAAAGHAARVWFIPLAVEYTFWEERQPELLMRFGQPLSAAELTASSKQTCDRILTDRLRTAQAELATLSISRDASQFEILLGGSRGTFFVYDWWRTLCGRMRGEPVKTAHGEKFEQR